MCTQLTKVGPYKIYGTYNKNDKKKSYIIHNTNKTFEKGHSHINNYNTAKYLATLALKKEVPERMGRYQLVSLMRISDSKTYRIKLRNKFFDLLKDVEID